MKTTHKTNFTFVLSAALVVLSPLSPSLVARPDTKEPGERSSGSGSGNQSGDTRNKELQERIRRDFETNKETERRRKEEEARDKSHDGRVKVGKETSIGGKGGKDGGSVDLHHRFSIFRLFGITGEKSDKTSKPEKSKEPPKSEYDWNDHPPKKPEKPPVRK